MELNNGTYYSPSAATFSLAVDTDELGNVQLLANFDVLFTILAPEYINSISYVIVYVSIYNASNEKIATIYGNAAGCAATRTAIGSKTQTVPSGQYYMKAYLLLSDGATGASIVGDLVTVTQPDFNWFDEDLIRRIPLGRELSWGEGDRNVDNIDGRTKKNKTDIAALLAKISPLLDDFFKVANAADPTKTVVFNLAELDPSMNITLVMPRTSGRIVVDGTTQATTFNNNVTIYGDLIQHGATVETEVETLKVADQVIILRDGATVALPAGEFAGFWIEHYDSEGNRGGIVIDAEGVLRIGDENDLQPVSTREEAPVAAGVAFWNPSSMRWETSTNFKYDGTRFIVARTTSALTPSSVVSVDWNTFAVNTLTLTTDTTLSMSGSYYTGQAMYIVVEGDYLLKVDSTKFEGDVLPDNVVPNYFGNRKNLVQLFCVDSTQNKFWIIVKNTLNVS